MVNKIVIISLIAVAIQNLTLTDINSVVSIIEHIVMIIARIIEIFLLSKKP
jgi:hypothetical protein